MKRGWLVVATALMALLALSCASGSKPAEPDRVVGVLLKCTRPATIGTDRDYQNGTEHTYVVPAEEISDGMCEQSLDGAPDRATRAAVVNRYNMRYTVTVRTSNGGGYSLEVPATTTVTVGQVWPPTP